MSTVIVPGVRVIEFASMKIPRSVFNPECTLMMPGRIFPVITRYATSRLARVTSTRNGPRIYMGMRISRSGFAIRKLCDRQRRFFATAAARSESTIPATSSWGDQSRRLPLPAVRIRYSRRARRNVSRNGIIKTSCGHCPGILNMHQSSWVSQDA
ncbi:MAG: hypothetical protein A4E40_00491 [Methanoregulaceae archaeon PtaU1.Bin059]|nr:MAG: hypothetical protein A4E40_00491 [Methanoregulaceae archaeon PtaU1.Bin059]